MSCQNCGFVKPKIVKMDIDEEPKKKVCRLCFEEYEGDKKEHNKKERHQAIKELQNKIKKIKNENIDQINGIINNFIDNE